jgi:hypothetical protein
MWALHVVSFGLRGRQKRMLICSETTYHSLGRTSFGSGAEEALECYVRDTRNTDLLI